MTVAAATVQTGSFGFAAAARRGGWGVVDQVVSSASNLALGVLVARVTSVREFGAFAVAYTLYRISVGAARALGSEPLVVRHSGSADEGRDSAVVASAGFAFAFGCATGALVLIVGAVVGGTLGSALVPVGLLMPALLVQDAWRYGFLAAGRPTGAIVNDAVWALAQTVLVLTVAATAGGDVFLLVLSWAMSGFLAAAFGCAQWRRLPDVAAAARWLVVHRDLGPRFLAEFASSVGANQLTTLFVGAMVGLEGIGALRAAAMLVAPLALLMYSLTTVGVAEAVRLLEGGQRRLLRATAAMSVGSVTISGAYGAVVLALPPAAGNALLRQQWAPARHLAVPMLAGVLALAMGVGSFVGLRALAAASHSLRVKLLGAAAGVVAGLAGAAVRGAAGFAWGAAAATAATSAMCWWQYLRCLRHEQPALEPRSARPWG